MVTDFETRRQYENAWAIAENQGREDRKIFSEMASKAQRGTELSWVWGGAYFIIVAIASYFEVWWIAAPFAVAAIAMPTWRLCQVQSGFNLMMWSDLQAIHRELVFMREIAPEAAGKGG